MKYDMNQDAIKQGVVIVGHSHRGSSYRLYELSCGHLQDVRVDSVRFGSFICRTCLNEKNRKEEEASGAFFVGKSDRYRNTFVYRLSCGHEKHMQAVQAKSGGFVCRECSPKKDLEKEAADIGIELLAVSETSCDRRIYRLPCGHEKETSAVSVRQGYARCLECFNEKLENEAVSAGLTILGESEKGSAYRTYRFDCGHVKDIQTSLVRKRWVKCDTCVEEKLQKEANEAGLKLLGKSSKNANYRLYLLPCGHEQSAQTGGIRKGVAPSCQVCGSGHYVKKGAVLYLVEFSNGKDSAIKIGVANDLSNRAKSWKLKHGVSFKIVGLWGGEWASKIDLIPLEKSIHKILKPYIHQQAKEFLSCGTKETYTSEIKEKALDLIRSLALKQV